MTSLQEAPAAERNKGPILEILKTVLPQNNAEGNTVVVLEIASGTGQHIAHFASAFPHILWQPTEVCQNSLSSIKQYIKYYNLQNVKAPIRFDVTEPIPDSIAHSHVDAIICTNMIHITPWRCTEGVFNHAGCLLKPGGLLITYGPYAVNGIISPQSNVRFDMGLRSQNPEWGIRDVRELVKLGSQHGLNLINTQEMPANNKILIFQKVSN